MNELTFAIIYVIGIFAAIGSDFLSSYLYTKDDIDYRDVTVSDIVENMGSLATYIFSWFTVLYYLCAILVMSTEYLKKYINEKIGDKVIVKRKFKI